MNPLNYASREASQRLVDKGIVLETEVSWVRVNCGGTFLWSLWDTFDTSGHKEKPIPAPSMAEVRREFTEDPNEMLLLLQKRYSCDGLTFLFQRFFEVSKTTDALIDLLIWTKGGKG